MRRLFIHLQALLGLAPLFFLDKQHRQHPGVNRVTFSVGRRADVIDRGLLSLNTALSLFYRYRSELSQHYPVVIFANDDDANDIRRSKPVLFLSVMATATGTADTELNRVRNEEILKVYAEEVIVYGERSLGLIQAITIAIAWYYASDSFTNPKFAQYTQVAAVLVLELGIDKLGRHNWTPTRLIGSRSNSRSQFEALMVKGPVSLPQLALTI